jgi:N6-adenosine-specific RNA methylase IME4
MTPFKTILADPPWPYHSNFVEKIGDEFRTTVRPQYPLMTIEDIKALPVAALADDNAHRYLWTTNSFMIEAHEVARAWGFEPKTILTWVKIKADSTPSMSVGYWYRSATEHILFCVRGQLKLAGPCQPTAFLLPRLPHSVKPDFFYDLIEEQNPAPRLEMFARRDGAGWDRWGNEVESTVDIYGSGNSAAVITSSMDTFCHASINMH